MSTKKTSVERLVDFVWDRYKIPLDKDSFRRIRAGHWQRSSGAWSWCIGRKDGVPADFGSQFSVKDILRNKEGVVLYRGDEIIIEGDIR